MFLTYVNNLGWIDFYYTIFILFIIWLLSLCIDQ